MVKKSDRKELSSSLKLLAGSSVIVFIGIFLSKLFTYGFRILIAREYGAEVYGLFILAVMVFGWFKTFANLGLGQGLLRFIALYRGEGELGKEQYILKKSLLVLAFTSVLSGVLLFFLAGPIGVGLFDSEGVASFLRLFAPLIPVAVLSSTLLSVIRAHERVRAFSFIENIVRTTFKLLALIALVVAGASFTSVAYAHVLGEVAVLIASLWVMRSLWKSYSNKTNGGRYDKGDKGEFKELLSYSWPLIFFGIVLTIFYWTDSFFLGIFMSVKEVGFYNAAVPIAMLLTLFKDLFMQLFFPLVTREFAAGNKVVVKELSQQLGKWVFTLSLPFFVVLLVFPEQIIQLLFGEEFVVASGALRFLAVGAMSVSLFDVSKELISMLGKSKLILTNIILASVLNVVLNISLIPNFGMEGAAFSTMVSLLFLNAMFLVESWIFLRVLPVRRKMLKVLLVGLLSSAVLLVLTNVVTITLLSFVVLSIFFGLLYITLVLLTGCLDANDLEVLHMAKKRFKKNQKNDALPRLKIPRM